MNKSERIELIVNDTNGDVFDEFKTLFEKKQIEGANIVVCKHLQESVLETACLGIAIYFSFKVLERIFLNISNDIADKIYLLLKDTICNIFCKKDRDCNLSIEIEDSLDENKVNIFIIFNNVNSQNVDDLFLNQIFNVARYIRDLKLPSNTISEIIIDYNITENDYIKIIARDWEYRREFSFDIGKQDWRKITDLGPPR